MVCGVCMENNLIPSELPVMQPKESVKLTKNTKGFNWEIRILSTNEDGMLTIGDLLRLDELNKDFERRYGTE